MKVAIVGGGFTGLTAAYFLAQKNHQVTLFEKEAYLGGLAAGFKADRWNWSLEKFYHHFFTNDTAILSLIKELGLQSKLILRRPITANYVPSTNYELSPNIRIKTRSQKNPYICTDSLFADIYQLDSPLHLFRYPTLSVVDKLRTACLLGFLKLNLFWQPLEGITAKKFFETIGGRRAWKTLWEPLMIGKFGDFSDTVTASWLWARIKKRTPKLCYIKGGFYTLVEALEKAIQKYGGIIQTNAEVISISNIKYQISNIHIKYKIEKAGRIKEQADNFDRVLLTVPTAIAFKMISQFQISNLKSQINSIPHLHAQTLILETKEPILKDTYWLNITDRSFPFLAVVAHTNFVDKKYYGGHHLTYFGNYLPDGHPYLSMNKEKLFKEFLPFIKRLNPSFRQLSVISYQLSVGWYAQPIHELHYSKRAPKLKALVSNLYLANMDSIYPWDRGTNYAIELGYRAARAISE